MRGGLPQDVREKLDTIYVDPEDRFVVALIVGYQYNPEDGVVGAADAAQAALDLTRDEGSYGTQWFVLDRQTGECRFLEQRDFEV